MNFRLVTAYLGKFLIIVGICMLLPIPWALYYRENCLPLLGASLLTMALGLLINRIFEPLKEKGLFRYREAFALVTLGWIFASAFGALPYLFSGTIDTLANAYYETMSGFTTTGASIIPNVEVIPKSILFWRCLTQWLGGMGILVLLVALLSQLGVGANQIFRAEIPGTGVEKVAPRIAESARILWLTYLIMSFILTLLLGLAGMSPFDALCHSFTTMATAGFSTRNLSIGYYSSTIQWIIVLFMFLAGANFALYFQALRGRTLRGFWKDPEFKLYVALILLAFGFVAFTLRGQYPLGETLIRTSLFQVVSIMTTTGFTTVDYAVWTPTGQLLLLLLMFVGGCSGSTAGSVKVGRVRIIFAQAANELKRLIHPRGVFSIRYGERALSEETGLNVLQFFSLYLLIFAAAAVLLTGMGLDYLTAFSAAASNLGNVGPGLGSIGPAGNYATLPSGAKWILSFIMLLGRLEIFTVLVMISPAFWRQ